MISSGSSARCSVGTMVAPSASPSWNWAGVRISGQLDTAADTHLEVGGDVGELEVLGEVKLRQVAHVGEVEHVPVLRAALGAAVQRRHVLARGSYTDQHLH